MVDVHEVATNTRKSRWGSVETPEYRLLPAGDTAIVVEFGNKIDQQLSKFVLLLARDLTEAALPGVIEAVPTFRSLLVPYEPSVLTITALAAFIDRAIHRMRFVPSERPVWQLPVC